MTGNWSNTWRYWSCKEKYVHIMNACTPTSYIRKSRIQHCIENWEFQKLVPNMTWAKRICLALWLRSDIYFLRKIFGRSRPVWTSWSRDICGKAVVSAKRNCWEQWDFPQIGRILPDIVFKVFDPCFDPYGIITQWIGQISMDLESWQTPQIGGKPLIIP